MVVKTSRELRVNWKGGGGFRFYRLGQGIFDENGAIAEGITFAQLAAHIWFCETGKPLDETPASPFLGVHEEAAYYLLYNDGTDEGQPRAGTLTSRVLSALHPWQGPRVIFGARNMLGNQRTRELDIDFRQIPYAIKGR